MTKKQLIDRFADRNALTLAQAKKLADEMIMLIIDGVMKDGETITFRGLGSFSRHESKARTGRNPQTGKEVDIPAKRTVKFKLASGMVEEK